MKTPAANRKILVLVAGLVWAIVGIALIIAAIFWLFAAEKHKILFLICGTISGCLAGYYGFSRLAERNVKRIFDQAPEKEKICVFAFQNTRSYFIVIFMMAFGYAIRHLPVERIYLVPIYLTIGIGLLMATRCYFRRYFA